MRSRFLLHAARIADAVAFWPVLALVVWGELAADPDAGFFAFLADFNDKVLHFTAYFCLSAMAAMAYRRRRPVALAVVALICLGGALEILQGIVGRDMSVYDEMANGAGAILGAILARLVVEPL